MQHAAKAQAELWDRCDAKRSADQLAILGGEPAFKETVHVGRPNIGSQERFLNRVRDMLDRKWLTNNGPFIQEFEHHIARIAGVKHCIATCNATVALELAIRASGLRGEVIIPSFTFVATAHALYWQEITPVFCDLDPATHNIDPRKVERLITPRTTGIIGVHLWGRPCAVNELDEIAERHHLKLLFDAAHAFGCSYLGRKIGSFGLAEVFSFHATKFLNTFEGGAVVTNDDLLAAKIRLMKNFGFSGYDNVIYLGTNGKMTEVAAAMGLTNLESLGDFIAANRSNYHLYRRKLAMPGVSLIEYDEKEHCNYQYIVVELDEEVSGISRDVLLEVLHAENILARRYFFPGCHQMEPYRSYFPQAGLLLPQTESLAKRVFVLPNGSAIGHQDIERICSIIAFVLNNPDSVRRRLRSSAAQQVHHSR